MKRIGDRLLQAIPKEGCFEGLCFPRTILLVQVPTSPKVLCPLTNTHNAPTSNAVCCVGNVGKTRKTAEYRPSRTSAAVSKKQRTFGSNGGTRNHRHKEIILCTNNHQICGTSLTSLSLYTQTHTHASSQSVRTKKEWGCCCVQHDINGVDADVHNKLRLLEVADDAAAVVIVLL